MNNSNIADAARVIEWANENPRRPAQIAFTDGPERQASYWIGGIMTRSAATQAACPLDRSVRHGFNKGEDQ